MKIEQLPYSNLTHLLTSTATRVIGDLTIILDGTDQISEPDFSKQKEFIVDVLDKFLINPQSLEV